MIKVLSKLGSSIIMLMICTALLCTDYLGQKKGNSEIDLTRRWSYRSSTTDNRVATSYQGRLFFVSDGGKLNALSSAGEKVWSSEFGGDVRSNLLVTENGLFFVSSRASDESRKTAKLHSISKDTGVTNWTVSVDSAERSYLKAFNATIVIVSTSGLVESVDGRSGAVKWTRQIVDGLAGEPAFAATRATIASTSKQIFSVSLETGETVFMRQVPVNITTLSQIEGATIVGDARGKLAYYSDESEFPSWTFKSGGEVSHIIPIGDNLLVGSHDNFVYLISERNGGRRWKKRLSGRIAQLVKIDDRYVLIATTGETRAEIVDLSGGKVVAQISFDRGEDISSPPIAGVNGDLFVLTTEAIYAYQSKSFAKK